MLPYKILYVADVFFRNFCATLQMHQFAQADPPRSAVELIDLLDLPIFAGLAAHMLLAQLGRGTEGMNILATSIRDP